MLEPKAPLLFANSHCKAKFSAFHDFHFNNDRLYENLCPSNVETRNHRFQRRHLVGIGSNDQTVGARVGLDG